MGRPSCKMRLWSLPITRSAARCLVRCTPEPECQVRIQTSNWAWWFARAPRASLTTAEQGLLLRQGGRTLVLPYSELGDVSIGHGLFWDRLTVETLDGRTMVARGIPKGAVARLVLAIEAHRSGPALQLAAAGLEHLLERDAYLTHRDLGLWLEQHQELAARLPVNPEGYGLPPGLIRSLDLVRRAFQDAEGLREVRNGAYVARAGSVHGGWFDQLAGHPMSDRQREAILHDEDNCLVVAGAGTGKTTTIVGKAGFLLRTGASRPEQILLLAFARKAKEELQERLEDAGIRGVAVRTFHSLGLDILAQARGGKPSLSKLAEDERALSRTVRDFLDSLFEGEFAHQAAAYFALFRNPYRSSFEFKTEHEHIRYLNGQDIRTLNDEQVRSYEECVIADWLFLNGVRYQYERAYEHDTRSVEYRQYKPDFYLPDYGLYIEHFGVDRQGRTASYVDPVTYRERMAWVRALHQQHGTRLVETFHFECREGVLPTVLGTRLAKAGVTLRPVSPSQVREALARRGCLDPAAKLIGTFLALFKGSGLTLADLRAAAEGQTDTVRPRLFLDIFERFLAHYQRELAQRGEIDFADMITEAARAVASGGYKSGFTHVLVDEFQDIGRGRAALLKALLAQVPGRRLFCVGDDWQSIFRFAGSDVGIMTSFAEHFGYTRRTDLDRTYRCTDRLLAASSRFVMANPQQLRKSMSAAVSAQEPGIAVLTPGPDEGSALRRALRDIDLRHGARRRERLGVLILGRYRHSLPADQAGLRRDYPRLHLRFFTIHRAKGLEADYAVLLDVLSGKHGFPSEVADDPVLDLLLPGSAPFPNAEERRLFYVGLTRARKRAFILTDLARRSAFVDELAGPEYRGLVECEALAQLATCPACAGPMVRWHGEHGEFWGCGNFPRCATKGVRCPVCARQALVRSGAAFRCVVAGCQGATEVCPMCGVGAVVPREGRFGMFWGCTEWRREGASCAYRRSHR